jgi:predicted polyphosphate/ATP-dependent NAD kinase
VACVREEAPQRHVVTPTIGVIVNPIAGLGGSAALKGSDGEEIQRRALNAGAVPQSNERARYVLNTLSTLLPDLVIVTVAGEMGETAARAAKVAASRLRIIQMSAPTTTATDTITAAREMRTIGVELLLFVGGDGTACDVANAVGTDLPVLGIPAGVKMQSAVFAISPTAAVQAAVNFLNDPQHTTNETEVVDIDEDNARDGFINSRLYGLLSVPAERRWLQNRKMGSAPTATTTGALAAAVVTNMTPETYYVLAPGTTVRAVAQCLGVAKTLLGVDVVRNFRLVASDVTAAQLEQLVTLDTVIIVSPTGGQGFLFGRGNQQISNRVLRQAGLSHILVICTPQKLAQLEGHPLLVDTGDAVLDDALTGYVRILTGPRETTIYRIEATKEKS